MMRPTTALQEKLYNEMVGHIKETDDTVPYRQGDYFYYAHNEKGKQYPINYRKKGSLDAKEELVFDQNELAKGLKFFSVGVFVPSDDGNLLAYSTDTTGYRQYKLQIKDLRTGQLLPESFERVGNVAWSTDNKTIFFTTEDAITKRSDKFFRHVLGSGKTDLVGLIFGSGDQLFDHQVLQDHIGNDTRAKERRAGRAANTAHPSPLPQGSRPAQCFSDCWKQATSYCEFSL